MGENNGHISMVINKIVFYTTTTVLTMYDIVTGIIYFCFFYLCRLLWAIIKVS